MWQFVCKFYNKSIILTYQSKQVAAMQHRHDKQTESLILIQQEITKIRPSTEVATEMQRRIVNHDHEIGHLKSRLEARKRNIEQNNRRVKELEKQLQMAQGSANEAREDLEQEQRLRLQAERKLNEYLDAQKRITAEFS